MSKHKSRRRAIKQLGLGLGAMAMGNPMLGEEPRMFELKPGEFPQFIPTQGKAVTAITLGAGARGNTYGNYAVAYPEELDIVGVAEPIPIRNERYAKLHDIKDEHRFVTWEHVFERPKFADAIIITTPDDLHYGPCMQALEMGYDVLLEKPIAPTEQECRDILELANRTGRIVAVCHVLRYAPYFIRLREFIQSGKIGELISIDHFEPIQHVHMAHSFVRGNWHNSVQTTPIILAKSCHDMDMMRWLVDKPCQELAAFGGLKWFRKENAPEGSTARCTDGCAVEGQCPYSAKKIYYRDRSWTYVFDFPDDKSKHGEFILEQLRTTNYGRCVYRMENDQPDHYVCSLQFADDITANFSMEAFTSYHGRRTRVMGAMGDIVGDMDEFVHTDFLTGTKTKWTLDQEEGKFSKTGHGGGDWALAHDWVKAVKLQDKSILTSTIDASVESHIMAFRAERSRLNKTVEKVEL